MNYSQRIKVDTSINTDKNLKVRLEKNISNIEVLSLNIKQSDIYQSFNANYGVLIGRVLGNNAIGIPNAKISIFIPITNEDSLNSDIKALYSYNSPDDINQDNKRYNLLPRVSTFREDGVVRPKQPFGSFPTKEETLTNDAVLDVYEKYYKYSTVTNDSGDYMLFGVPIGTQTVHMSVDITDIGRFSMTTSSLITNLGYSENFFVENGTKFKETNDLLDLPHIDTQEIAVDVIPFWGDVQNFEIGITRQDFRIKAQLINTFTIFGSAFTDSDQAGWGENFQTPGISLGTKRIRELYRAGPDGNGNITISIGNKRNVNIEEEIFYIKNTITDAQIESGNFNPTQDYVLLDKSSYTRKLENGDFVFIINCNRRKIITNEAGIDEVVDDDNPNGVFTEFRGSAIVEITNDEAPMPFGRSIGDNYPLTPFRLKFKIPQYAERAETFNENDDANTIAWRKQNYKFSGGSYYSVSRFHGTVFNDNDSNKLGDNNGFIEFDKINQNNLDPYWNTGIIYLDDGLDDGELNNDNQEFISNSQTNGQKTFGATWLNFSLHFPQHLYGSTSKDNRIEVDTDGIRSNSNFTINYRNSKHFYLDNTQETLGGFTNTKWLARSDLHYTDFIQVPLSDLLKIKNHPTKGFTSDDITLDGNEYKINSPDTKAYFYRGLNNADCVKYLEKLNVI